MGSDEIERRLGELDGWSLEDGAISKQFKRGDFEGSVAFVNDLTPVAEEMNHHPDLNISWDTVTVTLTTHSEGGLTESDFELAGRIDSLS
ncbi:MAG: 4a-hydroxytetrahydrobiopterin dehydratase [Actinomycetota bacterium]|nr:4a-hydroxytetrahydrobiopterin dehydratase [Actinomycetota bacterium]